MELNMKIRIAKVEQFSCIDKNIEICYRVERKYWFFWNQLIHPRMTTLKEAESWVENYIHMHGKSEQSVVVKEYNV